MQENYDYVQKGFRVLLASLSGFIGQELHKTYGENWWGEVLYALNDQEDDLPATGDYGELVDSLDIANCIRLINRRWNEVFRNVLTKNCRTYATELMGVRNIVAHLGQQDMDQPDAERALNTMMLLCKEIDNESAEEIKELYKVVRLRADDAVMAPVINQIVNIGVEQPVSEAGNNSANSLLSLVGTEFVEKTSLTRKVSFGGKTVVYPVYKVRLDALYYNDQNDRIATWITRYEAENGEDSLTSLDKSIYNGVIENFIYDSNPEALRKTQNNIDILGQKEPGVTLADGRIVDGNRRYTCLRRLQRVKKEKMYFETAILDMDINEDKKQIKLLELSIQHGEEKKVDYDLIDYAIGTYRDVVLTKLLSVKEYADSTGEAVADVKKRIEVAAVVGEFLEHIKMPEKYHIAREYQVYSLFQEMMGALNQLDDKNKICLKKIAFNNAMMKAIKDQRKFIRDIKGLIKNDAFETYFMEQDSISKIIEENYKNLDIRSKADIDKFADENSDLAIKMQISLENALQKSRSALLLSKPIESVSKSINLLMDLDSRLFEKMSPEDKASFKAELEELIKVADSFKKMV